MANVRPQRAHRVHIVVWFEAVAGKLRMKPRDFGMSEAEIAAVCR